jgi:hypothetical protein
MWKSIQGDYTRNNEPDQILDATNITFSLLALRNVFTKITIWIHDAYQSLLSLSFFTIGRSNNAKDDYNNEQNKKKILSLS